MLGLTFTMAPRHLHHKTLLIIALIVALVPILTCGAANSTPLIRVKDPPPMRRAVLARQPGSQRVRRTAGNNNNRLRSMASPLFQDRRARPASIWRVAPSAAPPRTVNLGQA